MQRETGVEVYAVHDKMLQVREPPQCMHRTHRHLADPHRALTNGGTKNQESIFKASVTRIEGQKDIDVGRSREKTVKKEEPIPLPKLPKVCLVPPGNNT